MSRFIMQTRYTSQLIIRVYDRLWDINYLLIGQQIFKIGEDDNLGELNGFIFTKWDAIEKGYYEVRNFKSTQKRAPKF
jgi:hypothetical protein